MRGSALCLASPSIFCRPSGASEPKFAQVWSTLRFWREIASGSNRQGSCEGPKWFFFVGSPLVTQLDAGVVGRPDPRPGAAPRSRRSRRRPDLSKCQSRRDRSAAHADALRPRSPDRNAAPADAGAARLWPHPADPRAETGGLTDPFPPIRRISRPRPRLADPAVGQSRARSRLAAGARDSDFVT